MRDAGYNPVHFAFPFSETIDSLDREFLLRFKTLRVWGDDSSNFSAAKENLYIWKKSQKYIRNLSIDRSSKVNSNQLREAIRFAKDKRLGLPVLFHGIDENPNNSYACSLDTLLKLVRIAQEEGIPFKTLSQVVESKDYKLARSNETCWLPAFILLSMNHTPLTENPESETD